MQRTLSYQKCYSRIIHSYILLSYNSLLVRQFLGQFQALVTWITVNHHGNHSLGNIGVYPN